MWDSEALKEVQSGTCILEVLDELIFNETKPLRIIWECLSGVDVFNDIEHGGLQGPGGDPFRNMDS